MKRRSADEYTIKYNSLAHTPKAGFYLVSAFAAAIALAGCGNGPSAQAVDGPDLSALITPTQTGASQSVEAAGTSPSDAASTAPEQVTDLPSDPPVPTISPNEVVEQAPVAEDKPAPVPAPSPRKIVEETIMVAEKPVSTVETTDVVETSKRIVERTETVETTERVIDRVEVDKETGLSVEQVEIIERTEKTVDTVEIDKDTGTAVETIVKSEPVEKETESLTVVVEGSRTAPDGPKDVARIFAGPDQIEPSDYNGYGVVAVRKDTPAADRDRLVMICDAFAASLATKHSAEETPGMVTVWPIASTAHADALNSASGAKRCEDAVERYGAVAGQEAIAESERTGWILDNSGPYLLAWSPPSDKGVSGASVLLVDLSGVSDPGNARAMMQRWSEDVERNDALWGLEGWNPEALSRVVSDWRQEFGPRTMLLLGTVGG
ncbi:MAG: hypothetical protein GY933_14805 [Hyphomicrobiales bacterium]|nr:hypothetical protein [Hyphomicrobiales bacterium]